MLLSVYGTLKRGNYNHDVLRSCLFIESGKSYFKYPMVSNGFFPYLFNEIGIGGNIDMEIYIVDDETIKTLNILEGVDEGHYYLDKILVQTNKVIRPCYTYFACHEYNQSIDGDLIYRW